MCVSEDKNRIAEAARIGFRCAAENCPNYCGIDSVSMGRDAKVYCEVAAKTESTPWVSFENAKACTRLDQQKAA